MKRIIIAGNFLFFFVFSLILGAEEKANQGISLLNWLSEKSQDSPRLVVWDSMIDLSRLELNDISGIATLQVDMDGSKIPITKVPGLKLDLSNNMLTLVPGEIGALINLSALPPDFLNLIAR